MLQLGRWLLLPEGNGAKPLLLICSACFLKNTNKFRSVCINKELWWRNPQPAQALSVKREQIFPKRVFSENRAQWNRHGSRSVWSLLRGPRSTAWSLSSARTSRDCSASSGSWPSSFALVSFASGPQTESITWCPSQPSQRSTWCGLATCPSRLSLCVIKTSSACPHWPRKTCTTAATGWTSCIPITPSWRRACPSSETATNGVFWVCWTSATTARDPITVSTPLRWWDASDTSWRKCSWTADFVGKHAAPETSALYVQKTMFWGFFLSGVHSECCLSGIFIIHALQRANPKISIFHTCSQVQLFFGFPSNVFVQAQHLVSFKSYFRAAEESRTTPNLHDVVNCSILKKKKKKQFSKMSPASVSNPVIFKMATWATSCVNI